MIGKLYTVKIIVYLARNLQVCARVGHMHRALNCGTVQVANLPTSSCHHVMIGKLYTVKIIVYLARNLQVCARVGHMHRALNCGTVQVAN